MPQRLVVIAGIFLVSWTCAAAEEPKPTRDEVPKLIENLGSKRYAEREAAAKRLALLDDVSPELQAATQSANAEISRRTKSIVAAITKRREKEVIAQEVAAINRIGFDRYVDRLVLSPSFNTEKHWTALAHAAEFVWDKANKLGHTGTLPQVRWAELTLLTELPLRYVQSSRVLVDGHTDRFRGFRGCFAVSSAAIDRFSEIRDSIVIINGDLPRLSSVMNSLVICTGDVGPISSMRGSVLLTTGRFDGTSGAQNSLVEAQKSNRLATGESNVYVNMGKAENDSSNRYVQTEQSPLLALKMFTPEMLGATFKHDKLEALVESVAEKSALAVAGLRNGDVLLSVEHDKWSNEDEFRTLLRKKSGQPGATWTIRRGGREMTLNVKFED